MQFPIDIELRRSRFLDGAIFVAHACAAASLLALPEPFWFTLPLLVWSGWGIYRRQSCSSLRLTEQGALVVRFPDGVLRTCRVLPDSTVFRSLIVLRLRAEDIPRPFPMVLLPDQTDAAQYRRLVLWLSWRVRTDETVSA